MPHNRKKNPLLLTGSNFIVNSDTARLMATAWKIEWFSNRLQLVSPLQICLEYIICDKCGLSVFKMWKTSEWLAKAANKNKDVS